MTQALHLSVTALLVPLLAVLAGLLSVRDALASFANPFIFLFLGGFALAAALQRHGLDRALAAGVLRLAGITREIERAVEALEEPPLRRARHRLPWLLVGFGGSVVATFVVSRFEAVLAAVPTAAFFVPALVYLADAIGTQSEAVAVRGLSLSRIGVARLLGGELRTGLLIGLVLALAAWPLVCS